MMPLPRGWAKAPIGALCKLQNGRAFKATDWKTTGLPIVRIQNLNNSEAPYNHFQGVVDPKNALRGGELLFAWSGTPGTSFGAHIWNGAEAVLNQHIFRVDFDEQYLDKRFFRHAINQKLSELIDTAHGGVGLRHVTKGKFEATDVLVPPRKEQTRIADKLDAVIARVNACRARLERVPDIIKRFRQSVFAAATSGELTREWREERARALDWTFERAADVCVKVQSGGTPKAGFVNVPGVPFLKVYNIVNQQVSFSYRPQYVTKALHEGSLAKSRTNPGDVVMNIVGPPLGKVAIVPADHPEWNINQAIALFRPSARIYSKWIYIVLCGGSNIREIQHETKGSAGQTNISLTQCRNFVFPVPSTEEQAELARRVDILLSHADRLVARLDSANTLANSLAPSALAKAFRGELVPQDSHDEPAPTLLARVRKLADDQGQTPPQQGRVS
jgi:type I restriction enzyme S subunit